MCSDYRQWVRPTIADALQCSRSAKLHHATPAHVLPLRGRLVRRLPVRVERRFACDLPNIRSYPDGYDVAELGTFPRRVGKTGPPEQA